jgi:quercetin 2,3-dioxygenase
MRDFIIQRSEDRGSANYGWLRAKYSFSFAGYRNPDKEHFGALRVLNDDIVDGGAGFDTHPHDNFEIVTIPLSGAVKHQDSLGNIEVIKTGQIQVMSAGSGAEHSEFNASKTEELNILQSWIFPHTQNVEPRYQTISFDPALRENRFQLLVSPDPADGAGWIHQDAWYWLGDFSQGNESSYTLKNENDGVFLFVIDGSINLNNEILLKRDSVSISGTITVSFTALKNNTTILLIEVPLKF